MNTGNGAHSLTKETYDAQSLASLVPKIGFFLKQEKTTDALSYTRAVRAGKFAGPDPRDR